MYARYTVELRDIIKNAKPALDKALSTYPLHTPSKKYDLIPDREELNKRVLNHYKYREIGFETVGRFLDELEITMCEIMPYYNERFKTIETMADIEDPFASVDMVETFEQEQTNTSRSEGNTVNQQNSNQTSQNSSSSTGSNTMENNTKRLTADTPQDVISIGTKNIDGVTYASEAEWNENVSTNNDTREGTDTSEATAQNNSTGTSSDSTESSGTVKHTITRKGAQGVTTFGHDMIEFRDSIIDVMNEIVTDVRLQELFMMVY